MVLSTGKKVSKSANPNQFGTRASCPFVSNTNCAVLNKRGKESNEKKVFFNVLSFTPVEHSFEREKKRGREGKRGVEKEQSSSS